MSRPTGGRARRGTRDRQEPVRQFFSIGDVCTLTDLKPHVLRYWETQFKFLSPAKNRSGNRVYQRREVELILLVKHLLYTEKFTIEGARKKVDEHRKAGAIRTMSRAALERETLEAMERDLMALVTALTPEQRAAPPAVDPIPSEWDDSAIDPGAETG
jgi:DNA-binding transcriptional MerR regulator